MSDIVAEDEVVAPVRKRARRNAIKPNSVESQALREFSVLHTFADKIDVSESRQESLSPSEKLSKPTTLFDTVEPASSVSEPDVEIKPETDLEVEDVSAPDLPAEPEDSHTKEASNSVEKEPSTTNQQ